MPRKADEILTVLPKSTEEHPIFDGPLRYIDILIDLILLGSSRQS